MFLCKTSCFRAVLYVLIILETDSLLCTNCNTLQISHAAAEKLFNQTSQCSLTVATSARKNNSIFRHYSMFKNMK